jgi:transcriptional regulator with XRE-family HTH domain
MAHQTLKSSASYIFADIFGSMSTLAERLQRVLAEMDGPDHGKQSRLADIAGCKRATMSHYLKSAGAEIGYEYAKNIADGLGYRVDWLIAGRGEAKAPRMKVVPAVALTYVDDEELALLTNYREATEAGKEYIRRSAELTEKSKRVSAPSTHTSNKS